MQFEPLDTINPVILTPPISGTVRSAGEQAMQHGEEDGAFECKPVLTLTRELLDDGPAPGFLPQPFEHKGRPDAPHVSADCIASGNAASNASCVIVRPARFRTNQSPAL